MRAAPSSGILGGAGKWITWVLTTAAAVTALLVNARNLGLTAWLGAVDVSFADHAATRVLVTPRADTLLALGDTALLAATVLDRRGAILTGGRLHWHSDDTTVAAVDSSGAVVARGPGRTRVTVGVRDLATSASIVVIQHPTQVLIASESGAPLRQGDTVRFDAVVQDANGHRIRGALPHWRSADPGILAIDSLGTAVAGAPGGTSVSATAGEGTAQLSLRVEMTPTDAEAVHGDRQHALAGRRLVEPIDLRVLAHGPRPMPGASVTFIPEDGLGATDPSTALTDRDGRVRTSWTLSPRAGSQRLVARVSGLDSALVFTAEADPVPGSIRLEFAGDAPAGAAGAALDQVIVVRVTDTLGSPLAAVPMGWSTPDGGKVQGSERTDSAGNAAARWSLGAHMGRQRLLAQAGRTRSIPPLVIVAAAAAGPPARVEVLGGRTPRGTVGRPLPASPAIRVLDALGNPIAGAVVRLRPQAGSVPVLQLSTDGAGRVSTRWVLGAGAGVQRLEVLVDGLDTVVSVRAEALAGAPAALTLTPQPSPIHPGAPLRIAATVRDAGGNPVPNAEVVFTGRGGSVRPARGRSDELGRVSAEWRADRQVAERRITATLPGTRISVTQTLGSALAGAH